jgi:hypothetical protein
MHTASKTFTAFIAMVITTMVSTYRAPKPAIA